ncbi:MAG TPA: ABC transporter ATP-binding protein, partial [Gammaproteobacteria bacterium]|nr:ABC transporter ATP-binding protein [Gammaproteobacteria bacterium]
MIIGADNLLEVRDLQVEFRLHPAGILRVVEDVSFRVRPGTTVALVGESGSGKSVISQAIMRILPRSARITGGSIVFHDEAAGDVAGQSKDGIDIARLNPDSAAMRDIRGGRIAMIFQEPMTSLSPLHTVGNQVSEALRLHQPADAHQTREATMEMLSKVGFPDPVRAFNTYPFELSGGLRQRAMIAMALICRPALLIADEPTTALDVTIQAQILKLIQDLQTQFHMAVLLITHDLGVVANMAEEVVVVYHGKLMERGRLEDIFNRPRHPYLRALMRAVPRVGMKPGERLTPIREAEGTKNSQLARKTLQVRDSSSPLLEVRGISKRYSIRKSGRIFAAPGTEMLAVDDVSVQIQRGECLGLVGESGCGKTTLSKIILRAVNPDSGDLIFNDGHGSMPLLELEEDALLEARKKIQYIFQDPFSSLNPRMTVFDIVSEPLVIHGERDTRRLRSTVTDLLSHVGLDPRFSSRYPHSFSGG